MNLKIALRNIARHRLTTFINIFGLAVGITSALLVFLFVNFERSYDSFHKDSNRIERFIRQTDTGLRATTPFVLAETLRSDFPDLTLTKIFKDRSKVLFKRNDDLFYEDGMAWADREFFNVFSFDALSGNPESRFDEPFKLAINESTAIKYFSNTNALGEFITMSWNDIDYPLEIVAVLKDFPENSHLKFDMLVSFKSAEQAFPGGIPKAWNMNYCYTYLKLPEGLPRLQLQSQLNEAVSRHVANDADGQSPFESKLQPLLDIHLKSQAQGDVHTGGDASYLLLAELLGALILIIACINFTNLAVARSHTRAKEIGIKKVAGAMKSQIRQQFLTEAVLISLLSLALALGILMLIIPLVNSLFDIGLDTQALLNPTVLAAAILGTIAIGFFSGLYPAIVLSSYSGLDMMRGILSKGTSKFQVRKILVVIQFTMTIILISGTLVLYRQLDFIQNKALGFEKEQILVIPHGRMVRFNTKPLKTEFLKHSSIKSVSLSVNTPSQNIGIQIPVHTSKNQQGEPINIATVSVDHDFLDTYDIKLLEGRNFMEGIGSDMQNAFIINESAKKLLALGQPLGESLSTTYATGNLNQPTETRNGQIIGVVSDFHFEPLQQEIRPMIFMIKPYWYFYISVKLTPDNLNASLEHLEKSWKEVVPGKPFEYFFLDDTFEATYAVEEAWGKRILVFSTLAIVLACMGLFGMVSFSVQRRLKEIGIRKVLGAAAGKIIWLISKEVLWLLIIANLIAWPLAWLGGKRLLQNFAYQIDISPFFMIVAALISICIALLTMSGQVIKGVISNPTEILRNE